MTINYQKNMILSVSKGMNLASISGDHPIRYLVYSPISKFSIFMELLSCMMSLGKNSLAVVDPLKRLPDIIIRIAASVLILIIPFMKYSFRSSLRANILKCCLILNNLHPNFSTISGFGNIQVIRSFGLNLFKSSFLMNQ